MYSGISAITIITDSSNAIEHYRFLIYYAVYFTNALDDDGSQILL